MQESCNLSEAAGLLEDLHHARPVIYWTDFLAAALAAWVSFAAATWAEPWSPLMFFWAAISSLAFYRAFAFAHECTHLRKRALPGFRTTWDALIGFPLLAPLITYDGVHRDHHNAHLFGTNMDPEYLPFGTRKSSIFLFLVHTALTPLLVTLRFIFMAPLGLMVPRIHRWLARYASSLSMNLRYHRRHSPEERRRLYVSECAMLIYAGVASLGWWLSSASWSVPILYYCIISGLVWLNAIRALTAHRYKSDGTRISHEGQFEDSVDIPGGILTELWAPVGLRYHALHHLFSSIPYHNLPTAYVRLRNLPAWRDQMARHTEAGLFEGLLQLWKDVTETDKDGVNMENSLQRTPVRGENCLAKYDCRSSN